MPLLNGGIAGRVFKHELSNTISSMGVKMDLIEYDKLWRKFDAENIGFVKAEDFLKKLGLNSINSEETLDANKTSVPVPDLACNSQNFMYKNNHIDNLKRKFIIIYNVLCQYFIVFFFMRNSLKHKFLE